MMAERVWLQCLGQKRQRLPALERGWLSNDLDLLSVCRTGVRLGWHLNGSDTCKEHSGLVACDWPQQRQHWLLLTTNRVA